MGDWRFGVEYSDSFLLQLFYFMRLYSPRQKLIVQVWNALKRWIERVVMVLCGVVWRGEVWCGNFLFDIEIDVQRTYVRRLHIEYTTRVFASM